MEWSGLIIGLIFGVILQKGRVCFNSAFRDVLMFKDNYLMKLAALTLALESIVFVLFAQFGWMTMNPKPLNWGANIVGGFIFGLGMVLAGGCASGVTYRVGEGMTTAWFAAVFYGLTGYATKHGAFNWWLKLFGQSIKTTNDSQYFVEKSGPTLSSVLHLNQWIVVAIFVGLMLWYVFGTKTTERPTKLGFKTASILIALLAGFAFITSTASGRHYGMGITGGWINLFDGFLNKKPLNWEGLEILGIIVGAGITAKLAGEFKLRMPKNPITYLQVMIGGFLMGLGAVTAGGCNVGHFLTGVPQLAISSIVASIFFILGNWTMAWLLYRERD
ncbi:transporter [Tepiditoga spiralis]|uniref:Transporter n=1 Tax=Tepiditoga spiralis TaxID=2108365 RepID=A0A7G1G7U5_9BACT|nr:YeeE/YedE family protein [Tepiditoga spiralis]BBE31456.1 transporter [Tepiditoga spiralis]